MDFSGCKCLGFNYGNKVCVYWAITSGKGKFVKCVDLSDGKTSVALGRGARGAKFVSGTAFSVVNCTLF